MRVLLLSRSSIILTPLRFSLPLSAGIFLFSYFPVLSLSCSLLFLFSLLSSPLPPLCPLPSRFSFSSHHIFLSVFPLFPSYVFFPPPCRPVVPSCSLYTPLHFLSVLPSLPLLFRLIFFPFLPLHFPSAPFHFLLLFPSILFSFPVFSSRFPSLTSLLTVRQAMSLQVFRVTMHLLR